jgi:hypothetical protein
MDVLINSHNERLWNGEALRAYRFCFASGFSRLIESEGNANALIEPVISAVSSVRYSRAGGRFFWAKKNPPVRAGFVQIIFTPPVGGASGVFTEAGSRLVPRTPTLLARLGLP